MHFPHTLEASTDPATGAPVLGFNHEGIFITDPTMESSGARWEVDPVESYGVSEEEAAWLNNLNTDLARARDVGIVSACNSVHRALGIDPGPVDLNAWPDQEAFSLSIAQFALERVQPQREAPTADRPSMRPRS